MNTAHPEDVEPSPSPVDVGRRPREHSGVLSTAAGQMEWYANDNNADSVFIQPSSNNNFVCEACDVCQPRAELAAHRSSSQHIDKVHLAGEKERVMRGHRLPTRSSGLALQPGEVHTGSGILHSLVPVRITAAIRAAFRLGAHLQRGALQTVIPATSDDPRLAVNPPQ